MTLSGGDNWNKSEIIGRQIFNTRRGSGNLFFWYFLWSDSLNWAGVDLPVQATGCIVKFEPSADIIYFSIFERGSDVLLFVAWNVTKRRTELEKDRIFFPKIVNVFSLDHRSLKIIIFYQAERFSGQFCSSVSTGSRTWRQNFDHLRPPFPSRPLPT